MVQDTKQMFKQTQKVAGFVANLSTRKVVRISDVELKAKVGGERRKERGERREERERERGSVAIRRRERESERDGARCREKITQVPRTDN